MTSNLTDDRPTWGDRVSWLEQCTNKRCTTTIRHQHKKFGKITYMSESGTAYIEVAGGGFKAIPAYRVDKEKT